MSKVLLKSLLISPAALGAVMALSASAFAAGNEAVKSVAPVQSSVPALSAVTPAQAGTPLQLAQAQPSSTANDQLWKYGNEGKVGNANSADQVTSVSQLSDVQPTDWAFQALQSLVERYGCIAGYPDGTYRGSRPLTRYEFAAGLNACMDRVNELIAAATADLVTKEDLATLQRLQEEFAAELATLRGRVDALEARTATLEAQQFSTTTKLVGEAIFAISSPLNNPKIGGVSTNNAVVFQDRVRLALQTSFTGKDLLVTRLDAGNGPAPNTPGGFSLPGWAEATQTYNFGASNNSVNLGWLAYYMPLGDKGQFYIPAHAGLHYDYAPTVSPFLDAFDGGTGPLSIFAQRNSIYNIGGGSGVGLNYNLSKAFGVSFGYLASNLGNFAANNPAPGSAGGGLFGGSYSALAQLTITPSDALSVGLTYVNAYRTPGAAIFDNGAGTAGASIGTDILSGPSGLTSTTVAPFGTSVNSYGASVAFKLSPKFVITGWGNYTAARSIGIGDGEIWSYAVGLAFPDLGKAGNLGGIVVGVQPFLTSFKNAAGYQRTFSTANPIHIEGFYKYQVSDNISITPGVIWIIAPGQSTSNDNVVIGTLRTTFTF